MQPLNKYAVIYRHGIVTDVNQSTVNSNAASLELDSLHFLRLEFNALSSLLALKNVTFQTMHEGTSELTHYGKSYINR